MQNGSMQSAESGALASGRFSGRKAFAQLVRDALACAARDGWREIILSDASFEDWPLGERAVAESLNAWGASGRHCTLLARRYDEVLRRHARFVNWRVTWSHVIDAHACPAADPLELPSAIWSRGWFMQRIDPVRSVGICGDDPQALLRLREDLHEWLGRSSPGFPASTLGL